MYNLLIKIQESDNDGDNSKVRGSAIELYVCLLATEKHCPSGLEKRPKVTGISPFDFVINGSCYGLEDTTIPRTISKARAHIDATGNKEPVIMHRPFDNKDA